MAESEETAKIAREPLDATQDHPKKAAILTSSDLESIISGFDRVITRLTDITDAVPQRDADSVQVSQNSLSVLKDVRDLIRLITETPSQDHPDQAISIKSLLKVSRQDSTGTREITYLDEFIQRAPLHIESNPQRHAGRYLVLLYDWCVTDASKGSLDDVTQAIKRVFRVLEALPPDMSPDMSKILGYIGALGGLMRGKYGKSRNLDDLNVAIACLRKIIDTDHQRSIGLSLRLMSLLKERLERNHDYGDNDDLDEIILLGQECVRTAAPGDPRRASILQDLSLCLNTRYKSKGLPGDIEEAIRLSRQAVQETPSDNQFWASRALDHSMHLLTRSSIAGPESDLFQAFEMSLQAMNATTQDDPHRSLLLRAMKSCFLHISERRNNKALVDFALTTFHEPIDDNLSDIGRFLRKAKLCYLLGLKSIGLNNKLESLNIVETAISILSREGFGTTLSVSKGETPFRYAKFDIFAGILGLLFLMKHQLTHDPKDRMLAKLIFQLFLKILPQDSPIRADFLSMYGEASMSEISNTADTTGWNPKVMGEIIQNILQKPAPEGLDPTGVLMMREEASKHLATIETEGEMSAQSCFEEALSIDGATITCRIRAAQNLLHPCFVSQDNKKALENADTAIALLPKLTPCSLRHRDKQYLLPKAAGLASDAAAVALLNKQPPAEAVLWLEKGRDVLASAIQDLHTDLSDLRSKDPELAAIFENSAATLNTPAEPLQRMTQEVIELVAPSDADQRLQAQKQFENALQKIRKLPGFERFLLPPDETEIINTVAGGPVVMINVSRHRCDALVIQKARIEYIELPEVSFEDIQQRRQTVSSPSLAMLEWLWDKIVNPVLEHLGFVGTPPSDAKWPRLWWVPTGPLVGFPLHAAGYHRKGEGQTAVDRVVSSYATSLRSIITTLKRPGLGRVTRDIVLVDMENTPGQPRLNFAPKEIEAVKAVQDSINLAMVRPQRRKHEVQSALENCDIFHFAGHGGSNPLGPLDSLLLLEDWNENPLNVESLLDKSFHQHPPFLAYLSACGTGQILDSQAVDENTHLISACRVAGFRHVIGTLWDVDDKLCVEMARLTYEVIARQGLSDTSVSYGLHCASRQLRDKWVLDTWGTEGNTAGRGPRDLNVANKGISSRLLWVPYVHYGV